MDIRKNICQTLLITIALSIITIVISGIVLGCNGDNEPIYKAISLYGDYFGGIATIVAAYIASLLFNDWRDPANYTTTKEQVLEAMGILSQVRFQLNFMHDNLQTLKRTNEFLILNEDLLNYSDNEIQRKFFEIVKNIKFLNDKMLFDEFSKINHHFIHSEFFYKSCLKSYKKYYDYLVATKMLEDKEIYVAPYRAYNHYFLVLDETAELLIKSLRRILVHPVGYTVIANDTEDKTIYNYENILEMIISTIALIDDFEVKLLDIIRVKNNVNKEALT